MNVEELKTYLQAQRISASRYFKTSILGIASAVERLVLRVGPYFEKDDATSSDKLIIHKIPISDPS